MKPSRALWISLLSLGLLTAAAAFLPLRAPGGGEPLPALLPAAVQVALIALLVWLAQPWRVAIRGARGDISISMAIDVAAMLLFHPLVAALGSALGTALYHLVGGPFTRRVVREQRVPRAVIRGMVTFSAVALGSWAARVIRPTHGPIVFTADWLALFIGISIRLLIRIVFYPLGMAALRQAPVWPHLRREWERLPLVPFLLVTTLGGTAALVYQYQPAALVLLFGPLASTWFLSQEFHRMNQLLETLEDKVAERTAQLAETVRALERRLAESEALHAVDEAISTAINPDEVLAVIARESVRVTGGSSALITLLTPDGSRQFVRATYGEGMKGYVGLELPMEGNLTSLVLQTGKPHVSREPHRDPRLNQELVRAGGWRDVIEAPIRTKDRTLGVLVVASRQPGRFDDQHLRLLTLLANQAGRLIENSELHAKAREVAVLEERNRLARELHDSVTQVLFGLTLNLESAVGLLDRQPEKARALLTRSREMAGEALAEMRSLIFELRPAALQEKGLAMALSNHINLFRRRHGVEVTFTLNGDERLSPDVEFALYRVAQEALNNVAKHAQARHVRVKLDLRPEEARLEVCDDGVGFDPTAGAPSGSFGMIGMKERVSELRGSLEVISAPGQGTCIRARIPAASGGDPG